MGLQKFFKSSKPELARKNSIELSQIKSTASTTPPINIPPNDRRASGISETSEQEVSFTPLNTPYAGAGFPGIFHMELDRPPLGKQESSTFPKESTSASPNFQKEAALNIQQENSLPARSRPSSSDPQSIYNPFENNSLDIESDHESFEVDNEYLELESDELSAFETDDEYEDYNEDIFSLTQPF